MSLAGAEIGSIFDKIRNADFTSNKAVDDLISEGKELIRTRQKFMIRIADKSIDGSKVVDEENRGRNRHNVEWFLYIRTFYIRTIFRLAKPAFFRYNENFTLGRDFYVTYFCNTGNT